MKLINYKKGYNNIFDCSIHGTIKMTLDEWKKARKWLLKQDLWCDVIFKRDIKRVIIVSNGYYINIRVTNTELLVKKYKLNNYKRGNYQLFIQNIK